MPVTIVSTVGGAASNSFVTLAEATSYLDGRLNADLWTAATTDSQNRSLVEAGRELNLLAYSSRKATDAQSMQWPRYFATNPDASTFIPWYFASNVIPQRVKDAQCELALEFIKAGSTDIAAVDPTISVKRKRVDVIETEYVDTQYRLKGLSRFPRVWHLIAPLLDSAPGITPIVRG